MKWYWWVIIGLAALGLILRITMDDGIVPELVIPDDADVEALGRMIASENGSSKPTGGYSNDLSTIQYGIAWAAVNAANDPRFGNGKSIGDYLMPGGVPNGNSGYAVTSNPATDATRAIAYDVLSGAVPDPTGGAVQFDAPGTQDILYAQGRYKSNAAMVAANRIKEGKVEVDLPGVDPNYMRWWRYA